MKITVEDVKFIQSVINMESISLATPVGEESDSCEMGCFIESREPSPEAIVLKNDNSCFLDKYLKLLDPRGSICIKKYYGLEDGISMTLEQIGKEYGVTRERIRQIVFKGINKLKILLKKDGIKENEF